MTVYMLEDPVVDGTVFADSELPGKAELEQKNSSRSES